MGFNYGYEKKKFDSRWKRLEVEYCDAGMSEEQIAALSLIHISEPTRPY